ncbi:hypothetical protein [Streptomyces sp. NPDC004284]|uniref:hypothetical protein n=1 Tax=Streptomyces sp. NPDC004284 TaxID=3364695 RepID=UPI003676B277
MVTTGALDVLASFVIMLDEFRLLQAPVFVPPCDLGQVLSCGSYRPSGAGAC